MAIFLVFLLGLLKLSEDGKTLWETKKSWNTEFRLARWVKNEYTSKNISAIIDGKIKDDVFHPTADELEDEKQAKGYLMSPWTDNSGFYLLIFRGGDARLFLEHLMEILAAVEATVVGNAVDGPVRVVAQHVLGLLHAQGGDQRGKLAVR